MLNRISILILFFIVSCSCDQYAEDYTVSQQKESYFIDYKLFIGFKDTSIHIKNVVYQNSNLKISPTHQYTQLPFSILKDFSIQLYTNLDTESVFIQPVYKFVDDQAKTCKGRVSTRKYTQDTIKVLATTYSIERKRVNYSIVNHYYFSVHDSIKLYK